MRRGSEQSCEQQARDMLAQMRTAVHWCDPQRLTAGDVVELANLIHHDAIITRRYDELHAAVMDLIDMIEREELMPPSLSYLADVKRLLGASIRTPNNVRRERRRKRGA